MDVGAWFGRDSKMTKVIESYNWQEIVESYDRWRPEDTRHIEEEE